jgi:hypothetical protein
MNTTKPLSGFIEIYLPYLLLWLASFVCFNFILDYVFFFQEKSGLFLTSLDYFLSHLNRPGGVMMYLSECLTSFYYFPLAGVLILSTIIVFTAFLVHLIQNQLSGLKSSSLPLLAGGTLLFLHSEYHFLLFNSFGILLQLVAFYLALKTDHLLKGWLPVFLFPLWYFLTGSLSSIFIVQYTIYPIIKKEKRAFVQVAALWFLIVAFVYFAKEYLFYFSLRDLLSYPFKISKSESQSVIYFALGGVLMLLPLIHLFNPDFLRKKQFSGVYFKLGIPVLIIAASLLLVSKQVNIKDRHYFQVEKLFYQEKYDEIIEYNRKYPSTNILTSFLNNISLSETGKLNEMLFQFPQSADAKTLFLPWDLAAEILKRGGYFYYEIGMINEAHRWAYENMVMNGYTPEGLKMLIKTELIDGNLQMANKYIDLLGESLFYRKDAAKFRELASDNSNVDRDPELGSKRKFKLKDDFFVLADDPILNLAAVVKSNPENRKALEYEMAFFLLKKDFKGIISNLALYEKSSINYLPMNVEEAVVAYKTLGIGDDAIVDRLNIRSETIDRFTSYLQTFKQFGNNKAAAQEALYKGFGNTFWYYIFYK